MTANSQDDALTALLSGLSSDGKDWERVCQWFLTNDPIWAAMFKRVWLWDEWPDRWDRDRGIDLVAQKHDGDLVAVQAKNYGEATTALKPGSTASSASRIAHSSPRDS